MFQLHKLKPVHYLAIGGFLFAVFLTQGMHYWDVDFSWGFAGVLDRSLGSVVWDWLSPFQQHVENWGATDRPAQFVVYKICYMIAGYHAWPYLLSRDLCFAGIGVLIYLWSLRLCIVGSDRWKAAMAAAVFFLLAPALPASMAFLGDFGPTSEFVFLALTYVLWRQIENTPQDWTWITPFSAERGNWLLRWVVLSFAVYLGYKTKADLKIVPGIVGLYVLLVRPRQWKLFGIPLSLMLLLAVPWSPGIFTKLPPFIPGSTAKPVGYSWQPATFKMAREFVWSAAPFDWQISINRGTSSLAALLGPFLLVAMAVFLVWVFGQKPAPRAAEAAPARQNTAPRARLFVALWFLAAWAATSVLPDINPFFRVRWATMTLTPAMILMAWIFSAFVSARTKLPRPIAIGLMALFVLQACVNLNRTLHHVSEHRQASMSVDMAFAYVNEHFPNDELAIWPGVLNYGYRLDASRAVANKDVLGSQADLVRRHAPDKTLVLAWGAQLWEELDLIKVFRGCETSALLDAIMPCLPGEQMALMRYIGQDLSFAAADTAYRAGNLAGARAEMEAFLANHPNNLAARVRLGQIALNQKDWTAAERAFAVLQDALPGNTAFLYSRATALLELKQNDAARKLLKRVVELEPGNIGAYTTLERLATSEGNQREAAAALAKVQELSASSAAPIDPVAAAEQRVRQAPTADNYLTESLEYYRVQRFPECIAAAQQAVKLKPDFAEAYNNMAVGFAGMKQWDAAIQAVQQALRLKPDLTLAKNNLAWFLSEKGSSGTIGAGGDDPLTAAEKQAKQTPTPENLLDLSVKYCAARRHEECVAAAREAIKLRPGFAEAYNNMAAGYEGMEKWDEAIQAAQEAIRLKPDFQLAKNNLAWSQAQKARSKTR